MYVRLSKLRKVVAEQAKHLFNQLQEGNTDRLRRGVEDNWPGESHDNFEEAIELEDFEFEGKKKDEEEPEEDNSPDEGGEDKPKEKPAFLKGKGKEEPKKAKKSPPKEEEPEEQESEDSGEEEEEPKKEPSPKHKKAKKGLEKAQKQKTLPKSQIDQKTGRKQDVDLDALAQLATEAGYRLEKVQPEEPNPDDDFGLGDMDGEQDFGLGLDPSEDDGKFPGDDDEMNFDDNHGKDIEDEDVALFSSDEDLADVIGQGHEEPEDDLSDLEGHPMSMKKSLPVAKQGAPKSGALKLHIRK